MSAYINRALGISTVILAVLIPGGSKAQSLSRRIADAPDGKVRLEFAAKPELCGNGNYVSRGTDNRMSWDSDYSDDVEYTDDCMQSPVRRVVHKQVGQVMRS